MTHLEIGSRYGRWTVTGAPQTRDRKDGIRTSAFYPCICDCGTQRKIHDVELRRGGSVSCGCLGREKNRLRAVHGAAKDGARTSEYCTWNGMRQRCLNPKNSGFPGYGGRGISICERWAIFANFLADMGPKPSPNHSIERIDNEGDYCPQNCTWATPADQSVNKRWTRFVIYRGERVALALLARRSGIPRDTLKQRIVDRGWDIERALSVPVSRKNPTKPEAARIAAGQGV